MKDHDAVTETLTKTVYLKAGPDKVWAYLTEAEKLAAWFHPAAADLMAGAPYQLLGASGDPVCWGEVTAMEPPRRLAYTFTVKPLDGRMTDVEWLLEEAPGGTRLTLIHTGLPKGAEGYDLLTALDAGWDKFLTNLRGV